MKYPMKSLALITFCFTLFSNYSLQSKELNDKLTILQINDVYVTHTLSDGDEGGLARIATLKDEFQRENPNTLLLLAGDFLSPSVASKVFRGKQMIDVLNASGVDIATIGNHEFDFGVDILKQRMKEAEWTWVVSNIIDKQTGEIIGGAQPYLIKDFGTFSVGFIGLCLDGEEIAQQNLKGVKIINPIDAAGFYISILEKEGVDYIVALTHQNYGDDRKLAERFPNIDLIIGGHEHFPINSQIQETMISKAGSNAKFLAKIDLQETLNQNTEKRYKLIQVDESIDLNNEVSGISEKYQKELDEKLKVVVGYTDEPLNGIAENVRSEQTNLGKLITSGMKETTHSDIAMLNGGAIRGNKIYPVGQLTQKDIITMHPFDDVVVKLEMTGAQIIQALNHGVEKIKEKQGRYPQVSGLDFEVDFENGTGRVSNVKINNQLVNLNKKYSVAITNYMLQGGDAYFMFKDAKTIVNEDQGKLLITVIEGVVKRNNINKAD
ncbi:MAG: 5'-nucleotidase C-terminal domain-containing protein [Candidatus Caenarcaniphilales bacterium]|nr:5'-nucleotidase C-terminal domain-containing protein [Candidatus Caenarcaniphilales bacterium]